MNLHSPDAEEEEAEGNRYNKKSMADLTADHAPKQNSMKKSFLFILLFDPAKIQLFSETSALYLFKFIK